MRPAEVKVFKAPKPTYDRNALYYVMDGLDWIYEPREPFTKVDVVVPGHFNAYRDDLRVGSRITCRLGNIADGVTEVELQVIERPQSERQGDIMVSLGSSREFTPVRHDGSDTEENKEEKAA